MQLIKLQTLIGPNIWSKYHHKLIVLTIEIKKLQSSDLLETSETTSLLRGNVAKVFPNVNWIIEEEEINSFGPAQFCAFLIGVVILELQKLIGIRCEYLQPDKSPSEDLGTIIYEYEDVETSRIATQKAFEIVQALKKGEVFNINAATQQIKTYWDKKKIGQLTSVIIDEAKNQGIPIIPLGVDLVIQLGQGVNQKRISKSLTNQTGFLGVKFASNKELTKKMLRSYGVPVPSGVIIFSKDRLAGAFEKVGEPVAIKPARGNNGIGVGLNIKNLEDARLAFDKANFHAGNSGVLVEKYITGDDYRFLIVDYKFVAAVKRTPASVTGNGHSTIKELIEIVNSDPRRGAGHSKPLTFIKVDNETRKILFSKGLTLASVLPMNEILYLKSVANLSAGGTSQDVTEIVHRENILSAERITKIIGIDICGLDIISPDISVPFEKNGSSIVEVNSAPGLRLHIAPTEGQPRNVAKPIIDMLFPFGNKGVIPAILINSLHITDNLADLLSTLLTVGDFHPAYTTSTNTKIQNVPILTDSQNYHERVNLILKDPTVDIAVLECTSEQIIESGMGIANCEIAIFPDFIPFERNRFEVLKTGKMSCSEEVIVSNVATNGYVILDTRDNLRIAVNNVSTINFAYFSLIRDDHIITDVAKGTTIVFIVNNKIKLYYHGQGFIIALLDNQLTELLYQNTDFLRDIFCAILCGVILKIDIEIIRNYTIQMLQINNLNPINNDLHTK